MHKEPAIAFASKGYHILLEKPMAVTEKDCKEVIAATKQAGVMLCVCHVLRYSPATIKIKELLNAGAIGDVVHIQHLEPVGFEHFAHSFVRGNWRNEKESAFSLLCKSCHDIDLINYWMDDKRCLKVSSFGSLSHFTKDDKPAGASDRCLDCMVEESCPYSAKKIYLEPAQRGVTGWPLSVICPDSQVTVGAITEALRSGPYGRCVYQCDNDVVTNQVVNMEFEEGATAALTMIAFSQKVCVRKTTIYGTKGELHCEGTGPVNVFDFHTKEVREYGASITRCHSRYLQSHGGADLYLIHTFCRAVALEDPSLISTGPDVSLDSHLLVFAAERARLEAKVIFL
uniref:putative oxidoreductase YteT isoform X2 n=1 Tax=Myxine glutinosa TaxID=7769 RepID=UPI00358EAA3D